MKHQILTVTILTLLTLLVSKNCLSAQSLKKNIDIFKDEFVEFRQSNKARYNPWSIHRKISAVGLSGSIAATFVGSLAMGDEFFATTVIPVVGPFITITRIENDPNSEYLPGGKQLLTASGIVQSVFLVYFVTSLIGKSNYKGKYLASNISVLPIYTSKGVGISMNIGF